MASFPNSSGNRHFHILDFESGGLPANRDQNFSLSEFFEASRPGNDFLKSPIGTFNRNVPILQVYATNHPSYRQSANEAIPVSTYVKPSPGYDFRGQFIKTPVGSWAEDNEIGKRARLFGTQTEEEALRHLYAGLEESLAQSPDKQITLAGWNLGYDINLMESGVRRYESLSKYHGWLSDLQSKGQLKAVEMQDVFFDVVHAFGQQNPEFQQRYLRMRPSGQVAETAADLRKVPGWSLEKVVGAMGGQSRFGISDQFHDAFTDVRLEQNVYESWVQAHERLQEGETDFSKLLHEAGIFPNGAKPDAGRFFESIYNTSWIHQFEQSAESGKALGYSAVEELRPMVSARTLAIGAGVAVASAVSYGLAFGKRKDRQTEIEGLPHGGLAEKGRHRWTDFGSGWRGLSDDSQTSRTGLYLGAGASVYATHLLAHRNLTGYGNQVYSRLKTFEKRTPNQAFNMFRSSQLASGYVAGNISFSASQLRRSDQQLTDLGEHLHRLLGPDADILGRSSAGIGFHPVAGSPYHRLGDTDFRVRFGESKGGFGLGGASFRWARTAEDLPLEQASSGSGSLFERWQSRWEKLHRGQAPKAGRSGFHIEGFENEFRPLFGYREGSPLQAIRQKAGILALDLVERPQKLLANVGAGLRAGDWNSASSLVSGLLLKRVLPAYIGYQTLKVADRKLSHHPSQAIASIPLKLQLARAELTDRTPGARKTTDWYKDHVGGAQYAPLALPLGGLAIAKLQNYANNVRGKFPTEAAKEAAGSFKSLLKSKWTIAGIAAALPFVPGMLGSRDTADELRRRFSGEDPVAVRTGRWWNLGSTPWSGNRIAYYKPHWFALMKAQTETAVTEGSEEEAARHNPLFHPLRFLKNPYWLEEKHFKDRPYPVTSPGFSNVPLIGPMLAATLGKLVKPVRHMHQNEWDGSDYTLFTKKMEPRGSQALGPAKLREEYGLKDVIGREGEIAAEFTGMPGFLAKTLRGELVDDSKTQGKEVYFQGSRQMTNLSRRYYERELGAGMGVAPGGNELFEYSEPLRRFIQRDPTRLQANEIRNEMPSWLPGDDYMTDFKKGDPYTKLPYGSARLPGAGYDILHPEVKGIDPENYSAFTKFRILADVAPYSSEYTKWRGEAYQEVAEDPEKLVEYEKTLERVKKQKESSITVTHERFSAPVADIHGTVKSVSLKGVELNELPGRTFTFSSIGLSAADLSAVALGEDNKLTRDQAARRGVDKQSQAGELIGTLLKPGTNIKLVVPKSDALNGTDAQAVVFSDGQNINQSLLDQGLASARTEDAGPEYQAMSGFLGNLLGRYSEEVSGLHKSALNPLRVVPTPYHSKLWQQRTALSQYLAQEVYGTRLQRWQHPIQKFVKPYFRGAAYRLTGNVLVPEQVREERDLNTLTDQLQYLRSLETGVGSAARTSTGANQFSSPAYLKSTIKDREKYYYQHFLAEKDPDKRLSILTTVSPELARTLRTQWAEEEVTIRRSQGEDIPDIGEGGRLKIRTEYDEYKKARSDKETELNFGDWERSKEVASFFFEKKLNLPTSPDSAVFDENIDYEDVKLKILEEEGYDYHDFNIFDDRAALLWRKPYIDGAVRELTSGEGGASVEDLRRRVEKMIQSAHDRNPKMQMTVQPSRQDRTSIRILLDEQPDKEIRQEVRRNREEYEEAY